MIRGVHAMFYSSEAKELREFLRDKLGFSATDTGDGWLIFDAPKTEIGCHPTDHDNSPPSGTHDISFYCDDLNTATQALKERGVRIVGEPKDVGYGRAVRLEVPGGFTLELYEPRYKQPQ